MNDPDAEDDLAIIASLARSRAGKTGPVREALEGRISRVQASLTLGDAEWAVVEAAVFARAGYGIVDKYRPALGGLLERVDVLLALRAERKTDG